MNGNMPPIKIEPIIEIFEISKEHSTQSAQKKNDPDSNKMKIFESIKQDPIARIHSKPVFSIQTYENPFKQELLSGQIDSSHIEWERNHLLRSDPSELQNSNQTDKMEGQLHLEDKESPNMHINSNHLTFSYADEYDDHHFLCAPSGNSPKDEFVTSFEDKSSIIENSQNSLDEECLEDSKDDVDEDSLSKESKSETQKEDDNIKVEIGHNIKEEKKASSKKSKPSLKIDRPTKFENTINGKIVEAMNRRGNLGLTINEICVEIPDEEFKNLRSSQGHIYRIQKKKQAIQGSLTQANIFKKNPDGSYSFDKKGADEAQKKFYCSLQNQKIASTLLSIANESPTSKNPTTMLGKRTRAIKNDLPANLHKNPLFEIEHLYQNGGKRAYEHMKKNQKAIFQTKESQNLRKLGIMDCFQMLEGRINYHLNQTPQKPSTIYSALANTMQYQEQILEKLKKITNRINANSK